MINENEEPEENEIDHAAENLESVGQMIIGGIAAVGGILTGDPVTRAEGEFNLDVGESRQEANKNLTAIDEAEAEKSGGENI